MKTVAGGETYQSNLKKTTQEEQDTGRLRQEEQDTGRMRKGDQNAGRLS